MNSSPDPALDPARILHPENEGGLPAPRDFQGIPGVAVSGGGELHAVWYGGGADEGPDNYVMLARSPDGGSTWSAIHTVVAHHHPLVRTFDPVLWTAPDGALWLFYAQAAQWWDGRAGVWAMTCWEPSAARMEWSDPRRIADGIMMNKPTVLKDGRWLLPVAVWSMPPCAEVGFPNRKCFPEELDRRGSSPHGAKVFVSDDAGSSFRELASVPVGEVNFHEHMLVEKQDGTLWMLVRGRKGIIESFSRDGGGTWSEPVMSSIPHLDARFFIRHLHSGRLLMVRHQTPAEREKQDGCRKQAGSPLRPFERYFLTAFLSDDDGATWSDGFVLDERKGVSYPDGDQLADGRVVVIYDFNRQREKVIHLAIFGEAALLAGEGASGPMKLRLVVNQAPWGTGGLVEQSAPDRVNPAPRL